VTLSDTVIFPTGGGQPHDTGTVTVIDADGTAATGESGASSASVVSCDRDPSDGSIVHILTAAVPVGARVRVVVDWARRTDHMQQHSAQHVASAIAEARGWVTASWNLGESVCAVEFDRPEITEEEMRWLEAEVNRVAREARPVSWRLAADDEGDENGETNVAGGAAADDADNAGDDGQQQRESRGIKNQGGAVPVRHVVIGGLDVNPCCGTHVSSTAEYAPFACYRTESKHKGMTSIIFNAGDRVLRDAAAARAREAQLSTLLSSQPELFAEHVARLQGELRDRNRAVAALEPDAAAAVAREIIDTQLASDGIGGANRIIAWCARDRGGAGVPFLTAVRDIVARERPDAIFAGIATPAPGDKLGVYLVQGPPAQHDLVARIAAAIAEATEGRGGGKGGRIQGKATAASEKGVRAARAAVEALGGAGE
jgi:misacylated tRNA(Ala) deacylase